jgi:D-tyrosyl-tRNA(Tyr) deacylase
MRAVVQRVASASVSVKGRTIGSIGGGVLLFVGISPDDTDAEAEWLSDKVANLRIFSDGAGKMNLSLVDNDGAALVVSQFTLYGDARKGRRPSFVHAAQGPDAETLYEKVITSLRELGVHCETGEFGAHMEVALLNEGPVTILLDSSKTF